MVTMDAAYEKLRKLGACKESLDWVESVPCDYDSPESDLQHLWNICPRGAWMGWLLCRVTDTMARGLNEGWDTNMNLADYIRSIYPKVPKW